MLSLGGKLPDDLSEALWALRERGCTLSETVRCSHWGEPGSQARVISALGAGQFDATSRTSSTCHFSCFTFHFPLYLRHALPSAREGRAPSRS